MGRLSQVGIAIGALGAVLMFMGLFPGVTGLDPTPGIGLAQIVALLIGFSGFITGALIYVKFTFYLNTSATLTQSIGTRLAMTGLVLAGMSGLADALGYGSHGQQFDAPAFLGRLQAAGIIVSYIISCIGVLVYAVAGQPETTTHKDEEDDTEQSDEVDSDTVPSVDASSERPPPAADENGQAELKAEVAHKQDT